MQRDILVVKIYKEYKQEIDRIFVNKEVDMDILSRAIKFIKFVKVPVNSLFELSQIYNPGLIQDYANFLLTLHKILRKNQENFIQHFTYESQKDKKNLKIIKKMKNFFK